MKVGDRVKVRTRKGDREVWRSASLVGEVHPDNGEGRGWYVQFEQFSNHSNFFEIFDIRLHMELTDEQRNKHEDGEELEKALPIVKEILSSIFLGTLKKESDACRFDNGNIFSPDNVFSIDPVTQDIVGIGSVREVTGYQVSRWHYHGGDRDSPPDLDDESLGFFQNIQSAINCFIRAIVNLKLDDNLQARDAYACQFNEDEMPF